MKTSSSVHTTVSCAFTALAFVTVSNAAQQAAPPGLPLADPPQDIRPSDAVTPKPGFFNGPKVIPLANNAAVLQHFPDEAAFTAAMGACQTRLPAIAGGAAFSEPVTLLTVGCQLITTSADTPSRLQLQSTGAGGSGFRVISTDNFTIHAGHPLFAIGIPWERGEVEGQRGNLDTTLTITLKQRGPNEGNKVAEWELNLPPSQQNGCINAWTDTAFNIVEVRQKGGKDPNLIYRHLLTGCRPRLKAPVEYRDSSRFEFASGAASAGDWHHTPLAALPDGSPQGDSGLVLNLGSLAFLSIPDGGPFAAGDAFFGDPTERYPRPRESAANSAALKLLPHGFVGVTGTESFNVCTGCPVHAFGFEIVEPSQEFDKWALGTPEAHLEQSHSDKWTKFIDSTFTITLYHGNTRVGDPITFNPVDNKPGFWGIHSPKAFTRVEIRETTGGAENELFGRFFVSDPCCCACGEKPAAK